MSVLNQSGDDAVECPLCMEPLEVDDLNFFPCTCGYQICRFCWHRIRTDENGLCPACRKAYSENPADFKPLSKEEISRLKAEKRLKDQQRKQRLTENRKHLANVRVVQKNLVFVVGLPMRLADADVLKRHEYFGKFGKIHKVVINQSTSYAGSQGPSASAYVTYQRQEDALRAIEAVNNIAVDGRTIKTSLGTTKYCSHFMRNQACPKPDCMYLHDLGDQEASFTKEEMHQGKHQDYERKLVSSLHAHVSVALNRKPTPSPPTTGNTTVRENGSSVNSQTKEAWPSLQPGQTSSLTVVGKDTISSQQASSPPPPSSSAPNGTDSISGTSTTATTETNLTTTTTTTQQDSPSPSTSSSPSPSPTPPQNNNNNSSNNNIINNNNSNNNNNNKGESVSDTTNIRRGKIINSESKAQAARNKQKNTQNNKDNKYCNNIHTSQQIESCSSNNGDIVSNGVQQKDINDIDYDDIDTTIATDDNIYNIQNNHEHQLNNHNQLNRKNNDTINVIEQSVRDIKLNNCINGGGGNTSSGDYLENSDNEIQIEESTPRSSAASCEDTNSSSSSSSTGSSNITTDRFDVIDDNCETTTILGTNCTTSSSVVQQAPPGLHANGTQVNHRSIFQSDDNSFFSSNTFQKISTNSVCNNTTTLPTTNNSIQQTGGLNVDWTTTCLASIPDSLPSVHSSEDWQAAFGFQNEDNRLNHHNQSILSRPSSPNVPFNADKFLDDVDNDDDDDYLNNHQYTSGNSITNKCQPNDFDTTNIMSSSPATKFMADFQQNSIQQRLTLQAQQNQERRDYIKHNGHGGGLEQYRIIENNDAKSDDDLGFDPFHETQKGLAELMENEMQLQHQHRLSQQRQLQQQQQQQQHQQQQHQHQHQQHQHQQQHHHHQQQQLHQQHHNHQQQQQHNRPHNHFFHHPTHQQQQPTQTQLHQRERDDSLRSHQNIAPSIVSQQFTHMAQLQAVQQAQHLQSIQVLHQSHSLLSRLPQNLLTSTGQSPQTTLPVGSGNTVVGGGGGNSIGQRSRLPPPGFTGSTPSHMNAFGLGIPRTAPINLTSQQQQTNSYLPNGNPLIAANQSLNKCSNDTIFGLKNWCDSPQQSQQQQQQQSNGAGPSFHHQIHQKGWNSFGSIDDWTAVDTSIIAANNPSAFQAPNTWQFSRLHPASHSVPHNMQPEQSTPAPQHWAMQPPPGFGGQASSVQQTSTAAQSHNKLISAGLEIENL